MRYCDRLHISTSTNDACSTVFDKSNYPYPPAAPNMGQWSWEGPTLCPWARHLSNLKDLNGPSPLAILWKLPSLVVLLSPRLNFSLILCPPLILFKFMLLWWKHRYKNRMKWGTAGQCVSKTVTDINGPGIQQHADSLLPWGFTPFFKSWKALRILDRGFFCVFPFVFLHKLIPDLFHFRFCTLRALLTHVSKRSLTYFI